MPDDATPAAARRRPELSTVILAVISLLYPFIAMIAVRTVGPAPVVIALCLLLVLRVVFGLGKGVPVEVTGAMLLVAAAVGVTALVDRELSVRLYPVFMGLAMLAAFASTLVRGPQHDRAVGASGRARPTALGRHLHAQGDLGLVRLPDRQQRHRPVDGA